MLLASWDPAAEIGLSQKYSPFPEMSSIRAIVREMETKVGKQW